MCDIYGAQAIYITMQVCAGVHSCKFILCNNSVRNKNPKSLQLVQAQLCVCVCVCGVCVWCVCVCGVCVCMCVVSVHVCDEYGVQALNMCTGVHIHAHVCFVITV